MTNDTAGASDSRFDPIVPAVPVEIARQAFELWQLPMIFCTAWWNEIMRAYWPQTPLERAASYHPVHHDPHAQLVVPEPIESEGEHALVA